MALPDRVEVVDSHTEGEPTRVVIGGWGEVPGATMAARRDEMRRHQDARRRALVCEPRGHAAMVGALLTPPVEPGSTAGVVFFDNSGYLGMCGHGTIGVVRTLDFLGRLPAGGRVLLDTPAGTVTAEIGGAPDEGSGAAAQAGGSRAVTIENVPARCLACDVTVTVPGIGAVRGDVAYGGNWFFLADVTQLPGLDLAPPRRAALTAATLRIRAALAAAGITGGGGAEIDHIEISGPPTRPDADSRNFVLCPGGAHDRSPCGTGTSAKLAVLHARGQLAPGQVWRQEGFAGGCFSGWLSRVGEALVPHIRGRAHITSRATLHFEAGDPFREGFPSS
jgi:proline racemase